MGERSKLHDSRGLIVDVKQVSSGHEQGSCYSSISYCCSDVFAGRELDQPWQSTDRITGSVEEQQ